MGWDGSGNRISFTSSTGGTTTFVYDPTASIPAVVKEITPTETNYYIREPSGALIARVSGNNTQYYHFDNLGSALFLTDTNGVITDRYTYDSWGKTTSQAGRVSGQGIVVQMRMSVCDDTSVQYGQ